MMGTDACVIRQPPVNWQNWVPQQTESRSCSGSAITMHESLEVTGEGSRRAGRGKRKGRERPTVF